MAADAGATASSTWPMRRTYSKKRRVGSFGSTCDCAVPSTSRVSPDGEKMSASNSIRGWAMPASSHVGRAAPTSSERVREASVESESATASRVIPEFGEQIKNRLDMSPDSTYSGLLRSQTHPAFILRSATRAGVHDLEHPHTSEGYHSPLPTVNRPDGADGGYSLGCCAQRNHAHPQERPRCIAASRSPRSPTP